MNNYHLVFNDLRFLHQDWSDEGYIDKFKSTLTQEWPDIFLDPIENFDKKANILRLFKENSSVVNGALKQLFAEFIDIGNKNNFFNLQITPFNIKLKRKSSLHTPYFQAGLKVIKKLDITFQLSITKLNAKGISEKDRLTGLIIYSFIRECKTSNLNVLKNLLSSQISFSSLSNDLLTITLKPKNDDQNSNQNTTIVIGKMTELLLRQFKNQFISTEDDSILIYNESYSSKQLLQYITKAIILPKTRGETITISKLLEWSSYYNLINNLPPLYCSLTKKPNQSFSFMGRDVLLENKSNNVLKKKARKNIIFGHKQTDLELFLRKFSKQASNNNNTDKRLTAQKVITPLTNNITQYANETSTDTFIFYLAKYISSTLKSEQKKSKKINIRAIAKQSGYLLEFVEEFELEELNLTDINEAKWIEIYNKILDFNTEYKSSEILKILKKFHIWLKQHIKNNNKDVISIDLTSLNNYSYNSKTKVNAVLVTPVEYALIKAYVMNNKSKLSERDHLMLQVILFFALRLGLRRWELINITLWDLQLPDKILTIREHNHVTKTINAKRKLDLNLIPDDEIKIIQQWLDLRHEEGSYKNKNGWMFSKGADSELPISYARSTDKIAKIMKKILNCNEATIHWLRHSTANWLWLALETQTNPKLLSVFPDFKSREFSNLHQRKCAEVLLGHDNFNQLDPWTSIVSLATIMGHSNFKITMFHYMHQLSIILYSYTKPLFNLSNTNVEFLLGIGKTKRNELFPQSMQNRYSLQNLLKYQRNKDQEKIQIINNKKNSNKETKSSLKRQREQQCNDDYNKMLSDVLKMK